MQSLWLTFDELTNRQLYAVCRLRQQVFVLEQTCLYEDLDGQDERARHLLIYQKGQLIASLRFFPPTNGEGVIGRVIVHQSARRRGLGGDLMRLAHQRIYEEFGEIRLFLSAQEHLKGFYEGLGYEVVGAPYDEDGILHVPMRMTPPHSPQPAAVLGGKIA